jgi:hypothetical protein
LPNQVLLTYKKETEHYCLSLFIFRKDKQTK